MYVPARFRIDAVRIGRRHIMNRHSCNHHIITKLRINCPERRIDNLHSFNTYSSATHRLNKRGTKKTTFQGAVPILIRFGVKCFHIIFPFPKRLIFIQLTHTVFLQIDINTEKFRPPCLSLTVECPFPFDCDVLGIHSGYQRRKTFHHHTFMPHFHKGQIIIEIVGKE